MTPFQHLAGARPLKIAALAGVALALSLPAASHAADRRATNAVVGGLLGAAAGGLIGGDATGALVGAGAGALLGAATTSDRRGYHGRYEQRYTPRNDYGYARGGYARGYAPYAYAPYGYYGR
jgi:predicted lipid-binding transport protein (Tim44 family)